MTENLDWNSTWTEKQLDMFQYVWDNITGLTPVDGRKLRDRRVVAWLEINHYLHREADGRWYTGPSAGHREVEVRWAMPAALLWRYIRPMLYRGEFNGKRGYSITCDDAWERLNIYHNGSRFYTQRDENEIWETLNVLASFGYIHFQAAGSVWEITDRTKER